MVVASPPRSTDADASVGSRAAGVRLVIVDDHALFAGALADRLAAEPDIEVLATVATAAEARNVCLCLHPTVITVDVQLGDDDGIALGRELHAELPDLAVVYVTCVQEPTRVVEAVRAGARAWVPKEAPTAQLIGVLRGAAAGESWLPARLLTTVLRQLVQDQADHAQFDTVTDQLTEREREVLAFMGEGLDRAEIATRLFLSANTVRTHTRNIFAKLDVHSSLEAVAAARALGLLPLPVPRGTASTA